MNIIITLLAIFVLNTLWIRYKPFSKKAYFKKQYKDLDVQIADLEFKRFKTKEGREEIRQFYTDLKAKLEALKEQMKLQDKMSNEDPKKLSKDERNRLDDDQVRLELQTKRTEQGRGEGDGGDYIMNLKDFDQMLNTANSQLDQLRSLKGLVKEYIKKEL